MKVVVHVEGPGDEACLSVLLAPLIRQKEAARVRIRFVPVTRGDHKTQLLTHVPIKAANEIRNDDELTVVVLPDLYPPNKVFRHRTCAEMQAGIMRQFRAAIERNHRWQERYALQFHVFCMIHDLEALVLAAEEQLVAYCGQPSMKWTKPVEQQNHNEPPKRVVEKLIDRYRPTIDGVRILAKADYKVIAARCPTGFGRFVTFLESL